MFGKEKLHGTLLKEINLKSSLNNGMPCPEKHFKFYLVKEQWGYYSVYCEPRIEGQGYTLQSRSNDLKKCRDNFIEKWDRNGYPKQIKDQWIKSISLCRVESDK